MTTFEALGIIKVYAESFLDHWAFDDDPNEQRDARKARDEYYEAAAKVREALIQRGQLYAALNKCVARLEYETRHNDFNTATETAITAARAALAKEMS